MVLVVAEASCEGENKGKLVMMEISLPEVAGMMRDTKEGGRRAKVLIFSHPAHLILNRI